MSWVLLGLFCLLFSSEEEEKRVSVMSNVWLKSPGLSVEFCV